jgi:LmbE family N-acetylglucosaminyl deacetylase
MTSTAGNGARFAARPLPTGGTPEHVWLNPGLRLPELDLTGCPGLVLIAPHPDDETLGFGATASTLAGRGVPVQVVSVTDGGGAYPNLDSQGRARLELTRRAELSRAVGVLGLDQAIRLGVPDGAITEHEDAVADSITELLVGWPPGTWCAATWRGDGHPDHEAVGRAAATAAERTGAVLLEYPVWMWHWAQPGDTAVPWQRAYTVPLSDTAVRRKKIAAQCFRSQFDVAADVEPILPPAVLARLLAVGEVVFR